MLGAVKNLLKESLLVQTHYRRYVQPHLPQYELETYLLRGIEFDQCLDVGAHAGTYSILLSHHSRHVFAFEPSEHSYAILRNLGIANLSTFNVALGDRSGDAELTLPIVRGKIDYALGTLRAGANDKHQKARVQKVKVAKLDDFQTEIDFNRIDFVKIDVEGFEMQVLRGMKCLIESRKPALLIEIEQRHNVSYTEVFEYLAGLNYQTYITLDGALLKECRLGDLADLQSPERFELDEGRKFRIGERKNYINNFFFLQKEHKGKFRL